MRVTHTAIKADVGSIGGHICPSEKLLTVVEETVARRGSGLIIDYALNYTGDDVAVLLTHDRGIDDESVHRLTWDAFLAGTEVAKEQGFYGAGQDMLKDTFFGHTRGLGPASASTTWSTSGLAAGWTRGSPSGRRRRANEPVPS